MAGIAPQTVNSPVRDTKHGSSYRLYSNIDDNVGSHRAQRRSVSTTQQGTHDKRAVARQKSCGKCLLKGSAPHIFIDLLYSLRTINRYRTCTNQHYAYNVLDTDINVHGTSISW